MQIRQFPDNQTKQFGFVVDSKNSDFSHTNHSLLLPKIATKSCHASSALKFIQAITDQNLQQDEYSNYNSIA